MVGVSLLSESENAYERQRLEHIKRNREYLRRLGVSHDQGSGLDSGARDDKEKKKRRRKAKEEKSEPSRRSSRIMGQEVEYTSDVLDTLLGLEGEYGEGEGEGIVREGKKKRERDRDRNRENRKVEVLELYKQWLHESRQALLDVKVSSESSSEGNKDGSNNNEWRKEAERRWGPRVVMVARSGEGGGEGGEGRKKGNVNPSEDEDETNTSGSDILCWKTFVTSRLSKPPHPSPDSLLQEFYAHDTWSLLVCCILMSRVSSWETKHTCISAFFKQYPTPSDLQQADPSVVREIMHPLGLFENRMKALLSLNHHFLTRPEFKVDLKENKIYGIGQFGVDSYNIFCKSNTKCKPSDKTLASYCNWYNKNHSGP